MNEFDEINNQSMRTICGDTTKCALGRIDQYDIIRKLGGGGFGVVYLVRDTISNVEYAIKTLHPLVKSNPEEMENLRSQFSLVSKLSHVNIVSAMYLHPIKEVEYKTEELRKELRLSTGDFVMVMKYAPGVTLSKWRKQFPNGIVPVDKAIDICKQIASALDYAHSEKIIHRDIKPGNIMVETCENESIIARVLDFGLAAEIRSSMSRVSTEQGDTSGTRPYMAPEQWVGKAQGSATDQYALAVVFYELISGAVPFAGVFETGDFQIMVNSVKSELPEELKELSEQQNSILQKALAKNAKDRFPDCITFVNALHGAATTEIKKDISNGRVCKKCKFESPSIATFCVACGEKFDSEYLCTKCMAPLLSDQKFCEKCGEKTPKYTAELAEANRIAEEKLEAEKNAEHLAREMASLEARENEKRNKKIRERMRAFSLAIVGIVILAAAFFSMEWFNKSQSQDVNNNINNESDAEINKLISDLVQIPGKNYKMSKYEVTQAQWQTIMGNNPSCFDGNTSRPVEQVTVDKCLEFIKKLNSRPEVIDSGIKFFLPTEEEWEYVSKASGSGLLTVSHQDLIEEMCWLDNNSNGMTHPVGQKEPNALGLYDMHGNVWEWTASARKEYFIYKGGGFNSTVSNCMSETEKRRQSSSYANCIGLRLAACERGINRPSIDKQDLPTINIAGIELVKIPDSAEHKGLYFGKYEVTQKQWQEIMGNNPSRFKGDLSRPVERVSWYDCQEFIESLNARPEVEKAGITFRLPTEQEWEYACRAGSTGKYGLLIDGSEGTINELAWYGNLYGSTCPVGQKKPNAWDLYDMHGNVWEWNSSEDKDRKGHRGGCFTSNYLTCEADNAGFSTPLHVDYRLGLRVVAYFR